MGDRPGDQALGRGVVAVGGHGARVEGVAAEHQPVVGDRDLGGDLTQPVHPADDMHHHHARDIAVLEHRAHVPAGVEVDVALVGGGEEGDLGAQAVRRLGHPCPVGPLARGGDEADGALGPGRGGRIAHGVQVHRVQQHPIVLGPALPLRSGLGLDGQALGGGEHGLDLRLRPGGERAAEKLADQVMQVAQAQQAMHVGAIGQQLGHARCDRVLGRLGVQQGPGFGVTGIEGDEIGGVP